MNVWTLVDTIEDDWRRPMHQCSMTTPEPASFLWAHYKNNIDLTRCILIFRVTPIPRLTYFLLEIIEIENQWAFAIIKHPFLNRPVNLGLWFSFWKTFIGSWRTIGPWKKLGCVRGWVTSVCCPKREEVAWPSLLNCNFNTKERWLLGSVFLEKWSLSYQIFFQKKI